MSGFGGLLDRYIARRFISNYGLVLLGFVMLFLVLDLASTLDDFLDSEAAFRERGESLWIAVGEYYLTKIPPTLTLIGPFLTLFAVISTLISFSRGNELAPMLVALNVYMKMNVPLEAPAFGRSIHPAPPPVVTVHDRDIDLVTGVNPYRELEQTDPEQFQAHLGNGRRVYFENCFYCHGDRMAGDGMFAFGLNPIPSNFTDQGVLPMLQESFLFWRISKGGPGLPEEGGPWDTAMPAWEKFLTEEEMWDVILFLYDYNNYRPRALAEHH